MSIPIFGLPGQERAEYWLNFLELTAQMCTLLVRPTFNHGCYYDEATLCAMMMDDIGIQRRTEIMQAKDERDRDIISSVCSPGRDCIASTSSASR